MKVVILAGGGGSRLWPYSREKYPKQILPILGKETLLQQTYKRLRFGFKPADIFVVTGKQYKSAVVEQLPGLPRSNLLLEPVRRDSAGAIGLAAARIFARDPHEVFISVHADHWVSDGKQYVHTLKRLGQLARQHCDYTILAGIRPTYPETGYGYVQVHPPTIPVHKPLITKNKARNATAAPLDSGHSQFLVKNGGGVNKKFVHPSVYYANKFIEKPNLNRARYFLKAGNYFWNVGWFAWRVDHLLSLYQRYLPKNFVVLQKIAAASQKDWQVTIDREFPKLQSISIDKGIAEKTAQLLLFPINLGWADIGHWRSVQEMAGKDAAGNAVYGESLLLDSANNLFFSREKKLIAALGVSNLVLIDTDDVILAVHRERAQEVKGLVERLRKEKKLRKYL